MIKKIFLSILLSSISVFGADKYDFILNEIDDNETKKSVYKSLLSTFDVSAHKTNYLLPFAISDTVYSSYVPSDKYTNIEAEFQFSIKFKLWKNLFGLNEEYDIAYTQHSFWQLYVPSSPFRETNYNPEFSVGFPINENNMFHLKYLKLVLAHQSNGQGNITEQDLDINTSDPKYSSIPENWLKNRSRSWNYVTSNFYFQYNNLFTELTLWYRFPDGEKDDNPDLLDYMGHGSVKFDYFSGEHLWTLLYRQGNKLSRYALEGTWSHPILDSQSSYFYVKVFSGYGESLIDYDNKINKVAVGISFSR